jgi:hypothetical protein
MDQEQRHFLSLLHLPARFSVEQTAWYLAFSPEDIPRLIKAGLLKPAGDPGPKATKVFPLARLRRLRENEPWIHKASRTIYSTRRLKNRKRGKKQKRLS